MGQRTSARFVVTSLDAVDQVEEHISFITVVADELRPRGATPIAQIAADAGEAPRATLTYSVRPDAAPAIGTVLTVTVESA